MTKICVFSDSHGCPENILRAMSKESPEYVIFLGDGERDMAKAAVKFRHTNVYFVRGNCDQASAKPEVLRVTIEGKKVFATHGHAFDVKSDATYWDLRCAAMETDANIVLFGHTHIPFKDRSLGMEILNPGTIGDVKEPTYGVITIQDGAISTKIKKLPKS